MTDEKIDQACPCDMTFSEWFGRQFLAALVCGDQFGALRVPQDEILCPMLAERGRK